MPTASTAMTSNKPPIWKIWWVAARPHTLTASISPCLVSYNAGVSILPDINVPYYFQMLLKWAAFCMLMQLGTNLHNDYADFVKGADTDKRVGQARATQRGWLTPQQTASAATCILGLGLLIGMGLIKTMDVSSDQVFSSRIFMAAVVLSSIFNAFAYTGGPWPLGYIGLGNLSIGYSGLGDLFVFLYFGLVATLIPPFLYVSGPFAGELEFIDLMRSFAPYAVQVALLSTNIIVVNNLRDRHTDVGANKRTLAVRFGAAFCRYEFLTNIVISYGLVLADWMSHSFRVTRLLPLLSIPLAIQEIRAIHTKDGSYLNPHVGGSARVQFLFCILLSVALRIG